MLDHSIFFDINLPNAATWFYFSGLLAIALFFKFARLLSVRNLDVLTLFALMPGLLLLVESDGASKWGYVWLVAASGYLLLRCLADLALVQRPALAPNLSLGGLAWLAGTLYVSLVAVAVRHPDEHGDRGDQAHTPIDEVRRRLMQQKPAPETEMREVRLAVERSLTLACHFAIVAGMVLVGWRHFQDVHAGMAAATFYLLLPYTYLLMPGTSLGIGRWDHSWPMALMVWAVVAFRRPTVAGCLLGLAAGSVFFPVVTFPVWFSFYRRRGAGRFAVAFVLSGGLCLAAVGALLLAEGPIAASLQSAWSLSGWLPWKELPAGTSGLWTAVHWAYRLPVFIVHAAFLLMTLFWPAPKNLAHVLALSAASLLGLQFWYADRGGVHVLWYLPFLLLLVFRPNLSACMPAVSPADDWLTRLARLLFRSLARLFLPPQPTTPVG